MRSGATPTAAVISERVTLTKPSLQKQKKKKKLKHPAGAAKA